MHPGEALDGRAIEADPVPKRALKLSGRDGDGLKGTEHVGEPEPDEPDVPLLQRPQYELFLPVHSTTLDVPPTIAALGSPVLERYGSSGEGESCFRAVTFSRCLLVHYPGT